jgi:adenosylhomocysteine nucleosidase
MPTLIVTPLRKEFDVVVQVLREAGYAHDAARFGRVALVNFPEPQITVAVSGHGKAQSAAQTQYVLDRVTRMDVVICAGVSGGLRPDLKPGDVVVATDTIEHDFRARINPRPSPAFAGDAIVVEELRAIADRAVWPFGIHFGTMASGDEDVIAVGRARELTAATGALGVAWEGAGVARTCLLNDLGFVEIRGITDAADAGAPTDFARHLETATTNVAALILAWLKSPK